MTHLLYISDDLILEELGQPEYGPWMDAVSGGDDSAESRTRWVQEANTYLAEIGAGIRVSDCKRDDAGALMWVLAPMGRGES